MRDPNILCGRPRGWRFTVVAKQILAVCLMAGVIHVEPVTLHANVFSKLGRMYGCIVTWGQVCDLSDSVVGTGPVPQPVPVTCTRPLMMGLPQFLSAPKGSAKYRFEGTCSSPARPGAIMTVRWEGSWTPSETKQDRPNASETLEITGFEPFLPDREPGGKIFMYWTARCTRDPWLQSPACSPFGAYVPDDLRQAFPDIDRQMFPRTSSVLSGSDKQRLYAEYQRVNDPYATNLNPGVFTKAFQSQASAPSSSGIVKKPPSQYQLLSRGIEEGASAQPDDPNQQALPPEATPPPIADEPSAVQPAAITVERPLHFISAAGEEILIEAGVYEVEPVVDLQLSLSREGQEAVFVPSTVGTHEERLTQATALLILGESEDRQHLLFLSLDGKRYEAIGRLSPIRSRDVTPVVALPNSKIKDAILSAPSGGALPPCTKNPLPYGPRWVPVPCALPTGLPGGPPGGIPSSSPPYLDGTNVLHACLNNSNGAMRIVRAADTCLVTNNEIKVKWQLVP